MSSLLKSYNNGNCFVELFDDGTKIRSYDGEPNPVWPESIDVKISDWCNAGCPFCHEKSTIRGLHGCVETGLSILKDMPAGTEIAIGGGHPMSWPHLDQFLAGLNDQGVVCNMTVNAFHIKGESDRLKELSNSKKVRGVGISYAPKFEKECVELMNNISDGVFHLIMGIHTPAELKRLLGSVKNPKVLLLGYKTYGRGQRYYSKTVEDNLYRWYVELHEFFNLKNFTLSFDNLGIKQMDVKRFFTVEGWSQFYMGDDGLFSMYLDLVKKQYCKSSTATERNNIENGDTMEKIFKHIQKL